MIQPCPDNADQLPRYVDCLRTRTLIIPVIPFMRAVFHLCHVIGHQGQTLKATTCSHSARRNEVVQRQRVEGLESATRTLDSLVDGFGQRIHAMWIVVSGSHILDVEPRLELLETLSAGIVNILGIGDELG